CSTTTPEPMNCSLSAPRGQSSLTHYSPSTHSSWGWSTAPDVHSARSATRPHAGKWHRSAARLCNAEAPHAMKSDGRIDALIIGAGHNGLVCASYLAAKGVRVRILERRDVIGGSAVTEEFHPGFRNSTAAYTVSLLHPRIVRDLRLAYHGLVIVERPLANFLPLP